MDLDTGRVLVAIDERIVLPTASIGKILLLIEVSARLTERDASGYGILDKTLRDAVGDSGVWQHLQAPSLPGRRPRVARRRDQRQPRDQRAAAPGRAAGGARPHRVARPAAHRAARPGARLARARRRPAALGRLDRRADVAVLGARPRRGRRQPHLAAACSAGCRSTPTCRWSRARSGSTRCRTAASTTACCWSTRPGPMPGVRAEAGVLRGPRAGVAYAVSVQFNDSGIAARLRVLDAHAHGRASTCSSTCTEALTLLLHPRLSPESVSPRVTPIGVSAFWGTCYFRSVRVARTPNPCARTPRRIRRTRSIPHLPIPRIPPLCASLPRLAHPSPDRSIRTRLRAALRADRRDPARTCTPVQLLLSARNPRACSRNFWPASSPPSSHWASWPSSPVRPARTTTRSAAKVTCATDGSYKVTWSVKNSESNKTEVITAVEHARRRRRRHELRLQRDQARSSRPSPTPQNLDADPDRLLGRRRNVYNDDATTAATLEQGLVPDRLHQGDRRGDPAAVRLHGPEPVQRPELHPEGRRPASPTRSTASSRPPGTYPATNGTDGATSWPR